MVERSPQIFASEEKAIATTVKVYKTKTKTKDVFVGWLVWVLSRLSVERNVLNTPVLLSGFPQNTFSFQS